MIFSHSEKELSVNFYFPPDHQSNEPHDYKNVSDQITKFLDTVVNRTNTRLLIRKMQETYNCPSQLYIKEYSQLAPINESLQASSGAGGNTSNNKMAKRLGVMNKTVKEESFV